jgi:hypothetical protein
MTSSVLLTVLLRFRKGIPNRGILPNDWHVGIGCRPLILNQSPDHHRDTVFHKNISFRLGGAHQWEWNCRFRL